MKIARVLKLSSAVLVLAAFAVQTGRVSGLVRPRHRSAEFIELLRITQPPVQRVPGTGVFLNRGTKTVPLAMRQNVEHNHALHETALIVSIEFEPISSPQPYIFSSSWLFDSTAPGRAISASSSANSRADSATGAPSSVT